MKGPALGLDLSSGEKERLTLQLLVIDWRFGPGMISWSGGSSMQLNSPTSDIHLSVNSEGGNRNGKCVMGLPMPTMLAVD